MKRGTWLALLTCAIVGSVLLTLMVSQINGADRIPMPPVKPTDDVMRLTFTDGVTVWHDKIRRVTCWLPPANMGGMAYGIACIPDWQLTPPDGGAE